MPSAPAACRPRAGRSPSAPPARESSSSSRTCWWPSTLDLGVAAGEAFQGAALESFHGDFNKINLILASLIPPVEQVIGRFSPLIHILDEIGGKDEVEVLDFSLDAARDEAWLNATVVSLMPPGVRPFAIQSIDRKAAFLGRLVANPTGLVARAVSLIRETESKNVPAIIDALGTVVAPAGGL